MCSLKKTITKLRTKRKAFALMKKMKSSRKSQKTKSIILQSEMKSSTKDYFSLIKWNDFSENSKTSNSSDVEQSNKVKNSWNNLYSTKASRCS